MRSFVGLALLFFLPGSVIGFWEGALQLIMNHKIFYPVLAGIIIGFILYYWLIRKNYGLLTFEHELTHAFMSLVFFRKITRFISTRNSGGVVHSAAGFGGEFGNLMISMAPYYLPTFTVILVLLRFLIPISAHPWYDGIIGFTLIFHLLSTIDEIKLNWSSDIFPEAGSGIMRQTDIARTGFLLAGLFIISLTLFTHGMIFWILAKGHSGFVAIVSKTFWVSYDFYTTILTWLMQQLKLLLK